MPYGVILADSMTTSSGASLGAGNATAFKNRLIDAGFIINQRVYVSGTALSSGTYAHDRWKAGASGCTYTFTQGSQGVPIQITITAGSLQQVIEGCNMAEGGTYVLSWTGTAQARFNGGTYGSSPLAITGITAGANVTIEFNTGTLKYPQLEVGSNATSFDYRPYGTELQLAQRYYETGDAFPIGYNVSGANMGMAIGFKVTKRAAPTITQTNTSNSGFPVTTNQTNITVNSFTTYRTCNSTGGVQYSETYTASAEL
jgi:hypothetical protein